MSKPKNPTIRASDVYKSLTRVLTEFGVREFATHDQRPHPYVQFVFNGVEQKFHFAGTPSSRRTATVTSAKLRRLLRALQMDALSHAARHANGTPEREHGLAARPAPALSLNRDGSETMSDITYGGGESTQDVGLHLRGGEPRVRDEDIARSLGFADPLQIRKLIKRHEKSLSDFRVLYTVEETSGPNGGRPSTAFYLNEEQALYIAIVSEAPRAHEVRSMLIRVFVAWRRGQTGGSLGEQERKTHGGITKSVVRAAIEEMIPEILREALSVILPAMVEQRVATSQVTVGEGWTAGDVIDEAGIKDRRGLRGLANSVSPQLQRFHAQREVAVRLGRLGRNRAFIFDPVVCREWLHCGGKEMILRFVQQRRGQGALKLIGGGKRQSADNQPTA